MTNSTASGVGWGLSNKSPAISITSACSVFAQNIKEENAARSSILRACAFCKSSMRKGLSRWISAVCIIFNKVKTLSDFSILINLLYIVFEGVSMGFWEGKANLFSTENALTNSLTFDEKYGKIYKMPFYA